MAWNLVSSRQIKDGAVLSNHIGLKEVNGTHIANNSILDSHIDLDWASKAPVILGTKKVVDYVQAPAGTITMGSADIDLTLDISLPVAATDSDLGVITKAPNNKVILAEKNEPSKLLIDEPTGEIIYGRIDATKKVTFFTLKNGVETAYTFNAETEYNLQFPARFTLETVSEMFAANEKFVDGAVDVVTRLDVAQIAADVFGDSYLLNKDGQPTLGSGLTISEVLASTKLLAETNATDIDAIELAALAVEARVGTTEKAVVALETLVRSGDLVAKLRRADKVADTQVSSYDLEADFGITADVAPLATEVDVYVNGMLQMATKHYTEIVGVDVVTGLNFDPNVVQIGDVVQLRWMR